MEKQRRHKVKYKRRNRIDREVNRYRSEDRRQVRRQKTMKKRMVGWKKGEQRGVIQTAPLMVGSF